MAKTREITPQECEERNRMEKELNIICSYIPRATKKKKDYFEVKQLYPNDIKKMAEYIYNKKYKDKDNYDYVNKEYATNIIDFMLFVAKLSGIEKSEVGQFRKLLQEKYGRDGRKWAEYIKAHKNEIVKKEVQSKGTVVVNQKPTNNPAPRPAFVSSGNADLDNLLFLRANMSCVIGFAKTKADNIRKNNDALGKVYSANGKDYNEIKKYEGEIDEYAKRIKGYAENAEILTKTAEKLHFGKKKNMLRQAEQSRSMSEYYKKKLEEAQARLASYRKSNAKKWTTNNNAVATYQELIKKDFEDIQKAYRDFESQTFCIVKQDYQYLDYLIYLFYSHRATTLKEALNELDAMLRHNELMSAIKNMSNQITQSMNNLSRQIESATASINANISYVNSNISYLNDNVSYLRQEVSQARSAIVSEQIETQSLIKEGNRIASMNYAANRDAVKSLDSIKMAMYR